MVFILKHLIRRGIRHTASSPQGEGNMQKAGRNFLPASVFCY